MNQPLTDDKSKRQFNLCADAIFVFRHLEKEYGDLEKVKNILHLAVTLVTEEIHYSRRKR